MPAHQGLPLRQRPRPDDAVLSRDGVRPPDGALPVGLLPPDRPTTPPDPVHRESPAAEGRRGGRWDGGAQPAGDGPDVGQRPGRGLPAGDGGPAPVDLDEAGPSLPARRLAAVRGSRPVVAAAVIGLVAGAAGGVTWAEGRAGQDQVATTRVLVWTDADLAPSPQLDGRVRVNLMVAGSPVVLERVRLGEGEGDAEGGVTLRPGERAAADLVVRPGCSAAGDGSGVPEASAVVRVAGSSRSRTVPVDVLADPSALLAALTASCPPTGRTADGSAEAADPLPASPVLVVSGLTADGTGRLSFTVRSRSRTAARLTLPVGVVIGSRARIDVRARPQLPLLVPAGGAVAVVLDVTAACRSHTGTLPGTYGLLVPQARTEGDHPASVAVEGWDDGVAAEAVTAAVLRHC